MVPWTTAARAFRRCRRRDRPRTSAASRLVTFDQVLSAPIRAASAASALPSAARVGGLWDLARASSPRFIHGGAVARRSSPVRAQREIDLRDFAILLVGGEERGALEGEEVGDDAGGKHLLLGVKADRHVVVELARQAELVFGRRQLFLQLQHVLVGAQRRVVLDHGDELAQGTRQLALGGDGLGYRGGGHGAAARVHHPFERIALELHGALYGCDQVGNQIMPALELHVDLLPGVLYLIAQGNAPVVRPDGPPRGNGGEDQERSQAR